MTDEQRGPGGRHAPLYRGPAPMSIIREGRGWAVRWHHYLCGVCERWFTARPQAEEYLRKASEVWHRDGRLPGPPWRKDLETVT